MGRIIVFLALLLGTSPFATATSYSPPERREVRSSNREYLLVVDPSGDQKVYWASAPTKELWSFKARVWQQPFLLSNDGQTVAELEWQHIQEPDLQTSNCITFHGSDGSRSGIPFSKICPDPPKTQDSGIIGPIGDFWRTWYDDLDITEDQLFIHTTTGKIAGFDIGTRKLTGISEQPEEAETEDAVISRGWIAAAALVLVTCVGVFLAGRRRRSRHFPSSHGMGTRL
ncbi:hypothetical protein OJ996_04270 [Luteolibacter sp. GHJ8]|uniref:Uncharacterized protein n=1 Tax=Luteolibacter rhizosphaerae TaxID=2989719 RepID=A0ABT3FZM0_9BACT|nr:hypothetical protein [Luteolibacter rhizosphaerae]MCW1912774.1 hypothetical protein [Luteolibacter rhizosphaerae]